MTAILRGPGGSAFSAIATPLCRAVIGNRAVAPSLLQILRAVLDAAVRQLAHGALGIGQIRYAENAVEVAPSADSLPRARQGDRGQCRDPA